ncbi:MAG: helix-turn-helix transcriptional regulator [Pseudomonadota bacterium]
MVTALVKRHGALAAAGLSLDQHDEEHHRLKRVLAGFASDVLTPQEREVASLMLGGHTPAQISEQLKVSIEMARVHRRNIHDKLGICSLVELFSRALAELAAIR